MTLDNLFFYSAKIASWFLKLENLFILAIALALYLFWKSKRVRAKRITIAIFACLLFFSNLGISYAALRTLENQHPPIQVSCNKEIKGVLVLGGGINPGLISKERGQTQLNDAAERLTSTVALLNKCSNFKVLYSTFSGSLRPEGLSESESAKKFFKDQGIAPSRTIFENKSRNTYENAKFSTELIGDQRSRWILITSASHMPRAIRTFEEFNWDLVAYPVDFRSELGGKYLNFKRDSAFRNWNTFIHERIGGLAYRIRGA